MNDPGLDRCQAITLLLDLARQDAEGAVDIGGRKLLFRREMVVGVGGAQGDDDLGSFLLRASRISEDELVRAREHAARTGESLSAALVQAAQVTPQVLRDAQRALWLDRLTQGLHADESNGQSPPTFDAFQVGENASNAVALIPLVLDALTRRSSKEAAERVGRQAASEFVWEHGPFRESAVAWLGSTELPTRPTVSIMLARIPAAAARVAALVRAGLGRLERSPEGGEPFFAGGLEPGKAPEPATDLDFLPSRGRLPSVIIPLRDPLTPLEEQVALLDESNAPPAERAAAWRSLARAWQTELKSLEEATRAYREAAAADPHDRLALEQAATLCAATGRLDLAGQYARSLAAAAPEAERARAMMGVARVTLRSGDIEECISVLEGAAQLPRGAGAALTYASEVLHAVGNEPAAIQRAAQAAAFMVAEGRTDKARSLLAWAHATSPTDPEILLQYADALTADGFGMSAVALLADVAPQCGEADVVRGLRLDAVQRAEAAGEHSIAAELLLEAYENEPHLDFLYEPLASDLLDSGRNVERAVVLESFASACQPENRTYWLTRAARAFDDLPGGAEHAGWLLARASRVDAGTDGDEQDDSLLTALRPSLRSGAAPDREQKLARLMAIEAVRGDPRASAEAAEALLEMAPRHAEAVARLERAAHRLNDPALRDTALLRRIAITDSRPHQAWLLTLLAAQAAQQEDTDVALKHTATALELDPGGCRAALIRARYGDAMSSADRAATLEALHTNLGDSVPLLRQMADLAHQQQEPDRELKSLASWSALAPLHAEPASRRITVCLTSQGAEPLTSALEAGLAAHGLDSELLRRGILRLAETSDLRRATSIALRAVDRLGDKDPRMRQLATELADRGGLFEQRVAAVERVIAHATDEERTAALLRVSELHHLDGNRAAEARSLVRILATEPRHPVALERLHEIFARAGETDRLVAVLTLQVDRAAKPEDRKLLYLDWAAAVTRGGEADPMVRELVSRLAQEDDLDLILLAAGVLSAVGQVEDGVTLLLHAGSRRPPAEAAGLLDKAVALAERQAKNPDLALRVCEQGLRQLPNHAPLLLVFERVALAQKDVSAAKRVYEDLTTQAMGIHARRGLLYRQARWLEQAGCDSEALHSYKQAFLLMPNRGVMLSSLERLCRKLQAPEKLAEVYEQLATNPHAPDREDLLRRAQDLRQAESTPRESETDAHDPAQLTAAEAQNDAHDPAQLTAAEAQNDAHDPAQLTAAEAPHDYDQAELNPTQTQTDEEDGPHTRKLGSLPELTRPRRPSEPVDVPLHAVVTAAPPPASRPPSARPHASSGVSSAPPPAPPHPSTEGALRDALGRGDIGAAEELGTLLATAPERLRESQDLLLWAARRDPSRLGAIRMLHRTATKLRIPALEGVTAEILSLVDPDVEAPDDAAVARCATFFESAQSALIDVRRAPWLQLLELVWEGAAPLFRRSLQDFGVTATDRLAPTTQRPLTKAFREACRVLGARELNLYLRRSDTQELFVGRTYPAALVASRGAEEPGATLRFRVGRAVELARSEHILLATLNATEGDLLLDAVAAAFGPPPTNRTSQEALSLGTRLWDTIPSRLQKGVRALLGVAGTRPPWSVLVDTAMVAGARAGLVLAGSLRASIHALLQEDSELTGISLESEADYVNACQRSAVLQALIAFALSDSYLAARSRALAQ